MLPSPIEWLNSGFFFPYKNYKVFYRQHRSKNDCILFLHGFPTSSWDWCKLWDELANSYRLLAPDFIGLGYSDKPGEYPYSIFDQADMIEYLISEVGSVNFHILAHDYGATVAQELIARYNEKKEKNKPYFEIKSVCFLNAGLFPGAYQPLLVQKILRSPWGSIAASMMSQFTFERSFRRIFGPKTKASKQEIAYFWYIINYNHGKRVIPKVIQYIKEREIHCVRWTKALQATDIPLRFLNGPEDPISGIKMVNKYKELIPNPNVILLDGIGHYPQMEAPEKMLKAYQEFLQSN